jgi:transcriptional regulator with XRE-family HTH domain
MASAIPRSSAAVARGKDPKNLGSNLRRIRIERGLSQGQLAERAVMADATISRIERNRLDPSAALITKLATALKVSADDLLGAIKEPAKARFRPAVAKLVATVEGLDDGQVDDVTKAVKLLLAVGHRSARIR